MARIWLKLVLAGLLASTNVSAGATTASVTATATVPTKTPGADAEAPHQAIPANGQTLMVQARAEMRCRFAFTSRRRLYKIYRVFLGRSMVRYDDWCSGLEAAVRSKCAEEGIGGGDDVIRLLRCDYDGRDELWQRGSVAVLRLNVPKKVRPRCVAEGVKASVPGSVVDWMEQKGCYEAYGFEIEY